jgi:hypothetical protein
MAELYELDEEDHEWINSRPDCVREMCRICPPNKLYRMKSTGQIVTLCSYNENGTVTVTVGGAFNAVIIERDVFGVDIFDLEECDFPPEEKVVGVCFTEESDIDAFGEMVRAEL